VHDDRDSLTAQQAPQNLITPLIARDVLRQAPGHRSPSPDEGTARAPQSLRWNRDPV